MKFENSMFCSKNFQKYFEPPVGFEPTTCSLQVSCTSHCAMEAFSHFYTFSLVCEWTNLTLYAAFNNHLLNTYYLLSNTRKFYL